MIRTKPRLLREQLRNACLARIIRRSALQPEQLKPLCLGDQLDIADARRLLFRHLAQNMLIMRQHPLYGSRQEQAAVIFHGNGQPVTRLHRPPCHIELGFPGSGIQLAYMQFRIRERKFLYILQYEQGIKERMPACISWHIQFLHEIFQRIHAMLEGVKQPIPDLADIRMQLQISPRRKPKRQRIDEHPHDFCRIRMLAAGDRRADDHVFLSRILGQQNRVGCEQHGKECRAASGGKLFQQTGDFPVYPKPGFRSFRCLVPGTGSIVGKPQCRKFSLEEIQPELLVLAIHSALLLPLLPYGIILILYGDVRKLLSFVELK